MSAINRVIGTLQHAAADPELRGPLVAIVPRYGELDIRKPPAHVVRSRSAFFGALASGLMEVDARAVGVVLPVRRLAGEERVCDYLDAEAVILVAVENVDGGVISAGLRCPLHLLPDGWEEAHENLQHVAAPLRQILARRPLESDESL